MQECKRCGEVFTEYNAEELCDSCYNEKADLYWQWQADPEPDVPFAEHLDIVGFWG